MPTSLGKHFCNCRCCGDDSYVQEISLSGVVIDDITFDPPPLADASGNVRRQLIVVKALRRPACYRDIIKCQISLDSTM